MPTTYEQSISAINAALENHPGLKPCSTCNLVFTVGGLERHSCRYTTRLFEQKFSWAYCPFLRLQLLYTEGDSYGDEEGVPVELRRIALTAAKVLEDNLNIRTEILRAFSSSRNHAYINGTSQGRLAKMLEDSGEAGQDAMTAFTTWATHCRSEHKQVLQKTLKQQQISGLTLNSAGRSHPAGAVPGSALPAIITASSRIADGKMPSPRDIAQHGRIHKIVPRASRKLFSKICRTVLRQYAEASSIGDKDAMLYYLVMLLQIPARALTIIPPSLTEKKKRRHTSYALNNRLRRLHQELLREAAPIAGPVDVDNRAPNQDLLLAKINHSLQLKRNGSSSRGRKALETSGLANLSNPSVLETLVGLFPERGEEPLPELPPEAPHVATDGDKFKKSIKDSDDGSGAGLSGWTTAHLAVIVEDPDCLR